MCFMGVGEIDRFGNVNSTKMGNRAPGAGGFIDITQNAKSVVFCTTFTASGLSCSIDANGIRIETEGQVHKFVDTVHQISFSAKMALQKKQRVVYITERAVFELSAQGLVLTELAQGADLERDVLAHMDFAPIIAPELKRTDARLYLPSPFGLGQILKELQAEQEERYGTV